MDDGFARRGVCWSAHLPALALLAALAGGCGYEGPGVEVRTPADFEKVALKNPKPTIVVFHKAGCHACGKLNSVMETLAKEYAGRVTFAKCTIMDLFFNVTSYELKVRYDVSAVPHATLIVDGQERAHWVLVYNLADYRRILNQVVPPPATAPATASAPAPAAETAPATQPAP